MKILQWIAALFFISSSIVSSDTWSLYTTLNDINAIERTGDVLWLATTGGVVRWNSTDGSYTSFNALNFERDIGYHGALVAAQGKNGDVWFGGDGWIMRYDGISWTTYDCPGIVKKLAVDTDGTLWIATNMGAVRFKDGAYDLYRYKDGFSNNGASCVVAGDDSAVWFGASGGTGRAGLYRFDGVSWTVFTSSNSGLPSDSISALVFDREGLLWIGTSTGIICTYDGITWNTVAKGIYARIIAFDSIGKVWCGSYHGLSVYDGSQWTTYTSENSGLSDTMIRSLVIDDSDVIWVSTGDQGSFTTPKNGLDSFDGSEWRNLSFPGPPGNDVRSVAVDHNGDVWISTDNDTGIASFNGIGWKHVDTDENSLSLPVYDIAVDRDNTLWFGSWDGVSSFDGEAWKRYTTENGLRDNSINVVAVDRDNVKWFGTDNGISSFDGETWHNFEVPFTLQNNRIMEIAFDLDNVKWFASYSDGVFRFDGDTWDHFTIDNGLANNWVRAIATDQRNVVWFGADPWNIINDRGITSFDGNVWITYKAGETLSANNLVVHSIVVDNDNVKWFGDSVTFDDNSWNTIHNGFLSAVQVNDAVFDLNDAIWFATDKGLLKVSGIHNRPSLSEETIQETKPIQITGLYPNPFNKFVTIKIHSRDEIMIDIHIYNLLGQKVRTIEQTRLYPGLNSIIWNGMTETGTTVSSGKYFFCLKSGTYTVSAGITFIQ